MPRYFFNLRYGRGPDKLAVDPEGDELPDLDAARELALHNARDLIARARSDIVRDWFTCSFEIEDTDCKLLLTIPFSATVPEEDDDEADDEKAALHRDPHLAGLSSPPGPR
ncbi:DUF6894 family protein [Methylobacterium trifolii]|uniref:DUF6894 domain-containing protein n=1 Tax=Methylobacterium trifolii TaxID=1003092 RepID=A0ABQ4TZU4_9HYPH|nr:hypothetical protein [Methylobacterium trifolii]GJE60748.1 hypothetical protein MPOCJGCO_2864 [Methylobacterium trifolii]